MRVRGCAMIREENKLLVLAYDYPKGRIHALPGGGVRAGETLADSVRRELAEELRITVEIGGLRYIGDMMAQGEIGQTVHVVFEGRIVSGTPTLDPNETSADEALWLDLAELEEVGLYPAINEAILEDESEGGARPRYLGNCMRREWA